MAFRYWPQYYYSAGAVVVNADETTLEVQYTELSSLILELSEEASRLTRYLSMSNLGSWP